MTSRLTGPLAVAADPPVLLIPVIGTRVPAGFPSPADDWVEDRADLNQRYIVHPEATFFFTVSGDSMWGGDGHRSIPDGATLIVDRAVEAGHDSIVVAQIEGDFTVKRLYNRNGRVALIAENPAYPPVVLGEGCELLIWGTVVAWIGAVR